MTDSTQPGPSQPDDAPTENLRTEHMRRHETDHDIPWSLPIVVRRSKTAIARHIDVLEATASTTIARTRVRVPPRRKVALAATAVRRRGLPAMVQR